MPARVMGSCAGIILSITLIWSIRHNADIILIFLEHNASVSENCERCMQTLLATRSRYRMYEVDKSGNILF